MSLAYLALERFRYRDAVEDHAQKKERQIKNASDEDTLEVVNDLKWLCREDCNGHTPRGFWANLYRCVFRSKVDEFFIAFLALWSAFTLSTGVAFNLGIWDVLLFLNAPYVTYSFFAGCLFALGVPASAVLVGRKCVAWGAKFADHCESEIAKIHKQSAQRATLPAPTPTPTPPTTTPEPRSTVIRRTTDTATRSTMIRDQRTGQLRPRRAGDP